MCYWVCKLDTRIVIFHKGGKDCIIFIATYIFPQNLANKIQ